MAWIDAELAAQGLTPLAGASDASRRALLETLVAGLPNNALLPAGFVLTPGAPPPSTRWRELLRQYLRKGLTLFFSLQVVVDVIGILFVALLFGSAIDDHDGAVALTWVVALSMAEAVLGLAILFLPDALLGLDPRRVRALISSTVFSGVAGVVMLILLWGTDVDRMATLAVASVVIIALTVADAIALTVSINRD